MTEERNIIVHDDMDLDALLGAAAGHEQSFDEPEVIEIPRPRYKINVLQSTSSTHPRAARGFKFFVKGTDEEGNEIEAYFEELSFLLVDRLSRRVPGKRNRTRQVSEMTMWPLDENGKQESSSPRPFCNTPNGEFPYISSIGKKIVDPRTGLPHIIGGKLTDKGFEACEADQICNQCPLSNWIYTDGDDVPNLPALCQPATTWVVWLPPQTGVARDMKTPVDIGYDADGNPTGVLSRFQGGSTSVLVALKGREAGQWGCAADGGPLTGIEHYFNSAEDAHVLMPINQTLNAKQREMVVGFCVKQSKGKAVNITKLPDRDPETFAGMVDSGDFKFIVLEVPVFPFMPNGRPEHRGHYTPVLFVKCFLVDNSTQQAVVPQFVLTEEEVGPEGYGAYLRAYLGDYVAKKMRDNMLYLDGKEDVESKLLQIFGSKVAINPAYLELPDGIEEGEILDEDALIDED